MAVNDAYVKAAEEARGGNPEALKAFEEKLKGLIELKKEMNSPTDFLEKEIQGMKKGIDYLKNLRDECEKKKKSNGQK